MVVHGRNHKAREAMFTFLRALGLAPIEWEQAVGETGMVSPHNLDAVRAAMDVAQAVVVISTAEDQAGLLPDLASDEDESLLRGQPRQNVLLEAGFAMGIDQAKTILVELGPIRRATDAQGLNAVRLTNAPSTRSSLRSRLRSARGARSTIPARIGPPLLREGISKDVSLPWQAELPISTAAHQQPSNDRAVDLHGAIQRVIGELRYNRKLIKRAADTASHWDPARRALVAGEWGAEYKLLASEPSLARSYRLAETAHQEIDQINHIVQERAAKLFEEQGSLEPVTVYPGDDLPGVLATVDHAISSLESVLGEP
jgi:hypothetical protein